MNKTQSEFNKLFDHTTLKPTVTSTELQRVCEEAITYGFCSVAVNTGLVAECASFLRGSAVKVDAAVGFPLGITTISNKVSEALEAIRNGADEVDYVLNIGKLKEKNSDYVKEEMQEIVTLCKQHDVISKVIFENCYLTDEEKILACQIALEVKPDYIKTSTGFGPSSASCDDVMLMKSIVGDKIKIKAAGGIRDLDTCLKMIDAGADRIGCSNTVSLVTAFADSNK